MSHSIFISRELSPTDHLHKLLTSEGFEINALPMISTKGIAFEPNEFRSGWLFFSSKQGVKHFFEAKPVLGKVLLGAIGEGTARSLRKHGEASFIGKSTDTEEVAKEFKKEVGRKKVCFPISDQSMRTVQQALPEAQVTDLICYQTVELPKPIGNPDVLVFSSPSNVQAFFKSNNVVPSQAVVSFGKSTATALAEHGVEDVVISKGTSDQALLKAIKEAIGS